MMTALPSDWKFQKEESPPSPSDMSPVNETPLRVHLEKGFYAATSSLSSDAMPWKQPNTATTTAASSSGLYPQDRWTSSSSHSVGERSNHSDHTPSHNNYSNWNDPDPSSQHSRSSIWADDHSQSSAGAGGFGTYSSFSKKGNIDEFSSGVGPYGDLGFSNLTVQSAHAPFRQRRSIGPSTSFEDDFDLTGSSFFETATVAVSSQDYGGFASSDSSIPGLMPASSGSTYGTSHSLFSSPSGSDMVPPPPPGFLDASQKPKYHHHQHHNAGSHHHYHHHGSSSGSGNVTRGGRQPVNSRRGPPRNTTATATATAAAVRPPAMHLGPLQEQRNIGRPGGRNSHPKMTMAAAAATTALPARDFPDHTSITLEDSSECGVSQAHSIDISTSSEAIRQLMKPKYSTTGNDDSLGGGSGHSITERAEDFIFTSGGRLPPTFENMPTLGSTSSSQPILPQHVEAPEEASVTFHDEDDEDFTFNEEDGFPLADGDDWLGGGRKSPSGSSPPASKKQEWLLRMNRKMQECPIGELDPSVIPMSAVMNGWAKSKSSQGAAMVEEWLQRAEKEYAAGNTQVVPTTKMYTMAVDAWARSGKGGAAAQRAEALLQQMYNLYKSGGNDALKPTTGIFNAVINAWARSLEPIAPQRAEQILEWMDNLGDLDVRPDKYTFNTVIHAYSKAGGKEAAVKAQDLLMRMQRMHHDGNVSAKADTITYNCVINCWAKSSRGGEAATEAEKLLNKMHQLYEMGDVDVKPNVVTYGAVIDAFAKSGQRGAASKADALLANMIRLHQSDPATHADLMPNTYVFNTVINCWSKSKERDAASKAEEMLVAMGRLHASGMTSLKPDAFTYTAVIDAWSKSFLRGAADRASLLLDKMETKYQNGDMDLKPNTFTYNAVINALAKSCEAGAAARAERVLQNMVNRHRNGGGDDVKPTTINFNTVLDAWAKSGGGRPAAERAEEILEWMDRLCKQGNKDVAPDTISFNAVLDAWARSGDRNAPRRCEQILDHMDELYRAGNHGVKPDTYTYNTLINAWAKSSMNGAASRAEQVLQVMEKRYRDGDAAFKPNTRTYTSVIDAWAKSSERQAARRCESILNGMIKRYEATGDDDARPNVHTANAVCNACAFSKHEDDRGEALQIAFRVFEWLTTQTDLQPDSYTYTILLSVCANLIPRHETATRYAHARAFFDSCRDAGYVNDYVLRKLRQTVTEQEYLGLLEYRTDASASTLPASWSRNTKPDAPSKQRKNKWNNNRRRG